YVCIGSSSGDVGDDVLRILPDSEEERGLALVQPVEADEEETSDRGSASRVRRPPLLIRLDTVDPAVVGPETVRPQDRGHAFPAQVELRELRHRRRLRLPLG